MDHASKSCSDVLPQLDLEQHPFNESTMKAASIQLLCTSSTFLTVLLMCNPSCQQRLRFLLLMADAIQRQVGYPVLSTLEGLARVGGR